MHESDILVTGNVASNTLLKVVGAPVVDNFNVLAYLVFYRAIHLGRKLTTLTNCISLLHELVVRFRVVSDFLEQPMHVTALTVQVALLYLHFSVFIQECFIRTSRSRHNLECSLDWRYFLLLALE